MTLPTPDYVVKLLRALDYLKLDTRVTEQSGNWSIWIDSLAVTVECLATGYDVVLASGVHIANKVQVGTVIHTVGLLRADQLPHSRACGWRQHPHGTACSRDCPTCRGCKLVIPNEVTPPPPSHVVVDSPNADVSGDPPEIGQLERMLYRITVNYEREGSGPGSRFAGLTLERVQARAMFRHFRQQSA